MTSITDKISALPPLRQMINQKDFKAKKSLGQNFIFDLNLTQRIAKAASPLQGTVFEIGPGLGGLTRALFLEGAEKVIAIEKDRQAAEFLEHIVAVADGHLTLLEEDAMKQPIWKMGNAPRKIVANLPYNIATALLLNWLDHASEFASFTLMFQKEVAKRLVAQPGDKSYGRLSILTQWLCQAELKFDVPPQAFIPPPKIISSVVHLIPYPRPLYNCRKEDLETTTTIAFGQRRKMLRASFKKYGGETLLLSADINPTARPQELSIETFTRLANEMRWQNLFAHD